jgi:TrmH family RNA methyltransferase
LTDALSARNPEVKRLRTLLRDPRARAEEAAVVLEGPRVVEGALDRGAILEVVYVGPGAERAFAPLVDRVRAGGTRVAELAEGVLEKLGSTRTPQPVLAVAPAPTRDLDALAGDGTVVVAVDVSDPGNVGTIIRSAEAAGADGVVVCGSNSVDPLNPKVVRSSAAAIFGVTVTEADDPMEVLEALAARGRRRLGAVLGDGTPYDTADLTGPLALVVGNEARGLAPALHGHLDGMVTIPMAGEAESLNVAMAATVVLFEAARQRRTRGVTA